MQVCESSGYLCEGNKGRSHLLPTPLSLVLSIFKYMYALSNKLAEYLED